MWICNNCNKEFDFLTISEKSNHSRWCDNNSKEKQSLLIKNAWKKGKYNNANFKGFKDKKHTLETKEKISISMKKSGKGWAINKDLNKRSYPEKWFIKNVLEKYELYSKYTIKEKMSFGKYFLDFAFLELKLDVEIDGQQHFTSIEAINHDKERDDFLINKNWKVYRIAWAEIIDNKNIIQNFLNFLNENSLYRCYNKDEILKSLNKKIKKYKDFKEYNEIRKKEKNDKNKIIIKKILNSYIDFSKFGWVKKTSELVGIKSQKINGWMKENMEEFYNKKCFKKSV